MAANACYGEQHGLPSGSPPRGGFGRPRALSGKTDSRRALLDRFLNQAAFPCAGYNDPQPRASERRDQAKAQMPIALENITRSAGPTMTQKAHEEAWASLFDGVAFQNSNSSSVQGRVDLRFSVSEARVASILPITCRLSSSSASTRPQ